MRRSGRCGRGKPWWLLLAVLTLWPAPAAGEGRQVHGENATFAGDGVIFAWGILKAPVEDQSQVVIRIVPTAGRYTAISIDGVDPFTQDRREVLGRRPLGDQVEVRSLRGTFADLPRREIHLYAAGEEHPTRPSLTVYFVGVPDTTPEFLSEAALARYLDETLAKLATPPQGRRP